MKKCILLCFVCLILSGCTYKPTSTKYHSVDEIKKRNELVVSVINDEKWITYTNEEDNLAGFTIEFMNEIAKDMDVSVKYVEHKTAKEALLAVEKGDVDIAASNYYITDERLQKYFMSDDYSVWESLGNEIIVIEDLSEEAFKTAKIAVVEKTYQAEITKKYFSNADIILCKDNKEVLEKLISKDVDASVFSSYNDEFYQQLLDLYKKDEINISKTVIPDSMAGVGLVIMLDNDSLLEELNKKIEKYKSEGLLEDWYKEAIKDFE